MPRGPSARFFGPAARCVVSPVASTRRRAAWTDRVNRPGRTRKRETARASADYLIYFCPPPLALARADSFLSFALAFGGTKIRR